MPSWATPQLHGLATSLADSLGDRTCDAAPRSTRLAFEQILGHLAEGRKDRRSNSLPFTVLPSGSSNCGNFRGEMEDFRLPGQKGTFQACGNVVRKHPRRCGA
jgi:hypothetical protein